MCIRERSTPSLAAGRDTQSSAAMTAKDIACQKRLPTGVQRFRANGLLPAGTCGQHFLHSSKCFIINDTQLLLHLGTALAAPQNAGIKDILQHPLDRCRVPILAGTVLDALGV